MSKSLFSTHNNLSLRRSRILTTDDHNLTVGRMVGGIDKVVVQSCLLGYTAV
jgi:hypothetical protein